MNLLRSALQAFKLQLHLICIDCSPITVHSREEFNKQNQSFCPFSFKGDSFLQEHVCAQPMVYFTHWRGRCRASYRTPKQNFFKLAAVPKLPFFFFSALSLENELFSKHTKMAVKLFGLQNISSLSELNGVDVDIFTVRWQENIRDQGKGRLPVHEGADADGQI